jgi:hypothetical protein
MHLRYTLRAFLIACIGGGTFLGLYARREYKLHHAQTVIRGAGGSAHLDYHGWSVRLSYGRPTTEVMRAILDLGNVTALSVSHTATTDEILSRLYGSTTICRLLLRETSITDHSADYLASMTGLERLIFPGIRLAV